jgi:nitroreductase
MFMGGYMDIHQAIEQRRTVRDFDDRPIPPDVLQRIIAAGLMAPTNNHLREWEFVVVEDKAGKENLIRPIESMTSARSIDAMLDGWGMTNADQRYVYHEAVPKQQAMILNAAAVVLPCFHVTRPLLQPGCLSDLNFFASIWCCIENMLLAACAEGIYGVTRIPFEPESKWLKENLAIPEGYEIPCYLCLGYPGKAESRIRQVEIHPQDRIHQGRW